MPPTKCSWVRPEIKGVGADKSAPTKEEEFFDKAEKTVLSKEEEQEMFEQFQSVTAITKKIEEIIKQIDYLENQSWMKG